MANTGRNCSALKLFHFERGLGTPGKGWQCGPWQKSWTGSATPLGGGSTWSQTSPGCRLSVPRYRPETSHDSLDTPDKVITNLITLIVMTIFNNLLAEAYNPSDITNPRL